jgi:hypothetical protein
MEPTDKMVPLNEMKAKDDYDDPTRIMCGDKQDGRGHKATDLKKKLLHLRKTSLLH